MVATAGCGQPIVATATTSPMSTRPATATTTTRSTATGPRPTPQDEKITDAVFSHSEDSLVRSEGSLLPGANDQHIVKRSEQAGDDVSDLRVDLTKSVTDFTLVPESVIGFDALWDSMLKCKNGVMWKSSVASFLLNAAEEIYKLERDLKEGTYKPRRLKKFTVYVPKEREIVGINFRDRVYQRSLNDNAVYPQMSRSWIYDNCACQEGKGTDFARRRLAIHMKDLILHTTGTLYCLRLDVKGYYPNMRHDVAEAAFRKNLDDWTYERVLEVLRSQYPGDVGYNPGSQIVQIAGVAVLSPLDHFIKEMLRCKHYVRYMDDMVLLSDDFRYLEWCKDEIERKLAEIGFQLNEKKTILQQLDKPFAFCGFMFYMDGEKIRKYIKPEAVKLMRRRVGRIAKLELRGKVEPFTAFRSYCGWRAHAKKGRSRKLLRKTDKWFIGLGVAYDPNEICPKSARRKAASGRGVKG